MPQPIMCTRILIADDDPLMRTLVTMSLEDIAQIVEAADGTETLRVVKRIEIGLLLLDRDMPAPDGMAVLKILRSRGFDVPVIMITAEADRSHVLEAIHAGASDYLIKPFDYRTLREKVMRFCTPLPLEPVH